MAGISEFIAERQLSHFDKGHADDGAGMRKALKYVTWDEARQSAI